MRDWPHSPVHRLDEPGAYFVTGGTYLKKPVFRGAHVSYPKSYFARLSYVHRNAVHHRLVREASLYPWCSAGWLELRADPSFHRRIMAMKIDGVKVEDAFEVDVADI